MADLDLVHHRGGSGEPLVLVHGIGSCWRCWDPLFARLEEHHEVFAVDLPGYGESPPLEGEPTFYALSDELERALLAADLDGAHLVGNSMGGWIVAELAAKGLAKTAVAISPAGLATQREIKWTRASLRNLPKAARLIEPRAERLARTRAGRVLMAGQMHSRAWRVEPDSLVHQVRMLANSPSFAAALDWACSAGAQPRGLDQIKCPFRVVWGTRDLILPYRQAKRWLEVVPHAELVTLKGMGHLPMPDDPDAVADAILGLTTARREPAQRAAAPA